MYHQHLFSVISLDRCTDDSGGTVNSPMAVQYNTGKAALIRAVGCIQEELNLDGENNIAVYALHPGGVLSGLQGPPSLHLLLPLPFVVSP